MLQNAVMDFVPTYEYDWWSSSFCAGVEMALSAAGLPTDKWIKKYGQTFSASCLRSPNHEV